jgi:hypothetical protein
MLKSIKKKINAPFKKWLANMSPKRINFLKLVVSYWTFQQFLQNHKNSQLLKDRFALYEFLSLRSKKSSIVYIEFGVFEGETIKIWTMLNTHKDSRFWGFDSFEGLPEDWALNAGEGIREKGTFDVGGKIPIINDSRVNLIKGIFQHTVVPFIDEYKITIESTQNLIIHLDADLYSSQLFCMAQMYRCLPKNFIFILDDFDVFEHDFKALTDFCKSHLMDCEMIAHTPKYSKAAFYMTKRDSY